MKTPERGSAYNPEESSGYNTLEIIDRTLLAGDADEYVCRLLFRDIVWADETVETGLPVDGGRYVENGTEYRYFDWAVHVKRVGEFTYELVGVAETQQALAALEAAHRGRKGGLCVPSDAGSEAAGRLQGEDPGRCPAGYLGQWSKLEGRPDFSGKAHQPG